MSGAGTRQTQDGIQEPTPWGCKQGSICTATSGRTRFASQIPRAWRSTCAVGLRGVFLESRITATCGMTAMGRRRISAIAASGQMQKRPGRVRMPATTYREVTGARTES